MVLNNVPGFETAVKLNGEAVEVVLPSPLKILVVFAGAGVRLNADEMVGLALKLGIPGTDVVVDANENPL